MTTIERVLEADSLVVSENPQQLEIAFPNNSPESVSDERVQRLSAAVLRLGQKALECAQLPLDSRWNFMVVTPKQKGQYVEKIVIDQGDEGSYVIDHSKLLPMTSGKWESHTRVEVLADATATAVHLSADREHNTFGDEPVDYLVKRMGNFTCSEVEIFLIEDANQLEPAH